MLADFILIPDKHWIEFWTSERTINLSRRICMLEFHHSRAGGMMSPARGRGRAATAAINYQRLPCHTSHRATLRHHSSHQLPAPNMPHQPQGEDAQPQQPSITSAYQAIPATGRGCGTTATINYQRHQAIPATGRGCGTTAAINYQRYHTTHYYYYS